MHNLKYAHRIPNLLFKNTNNRSKTKDEGCEKQVEFIDLPLSALEAAECEHNPAGKQRNL